MRRPTISSVRTPACGIRRGASPSRGCRGGRRPRGDDHEGGQHDGARDPPLRSSRAGGSSTEAASSVAISRSRCSRDSGSPGPPLAVGAPSTVKPRCSSSARVRRMSMGSTTSRMRATPRGRSSRSSAADSSRVVWAPCAGTMRSLRDAQPLGQPHPRVHFPAVAQEHEERSQVLAIERDRAHGAAERPVGEDLVAVRAAAPRHHDGLRGPQVGGAGHPSVEHVGERGEAADPDEEQEPAPRRRRKPAPPPSTFRAAIACARIDLTVRSPLAIMPPAPRARQGRPRP